MSKVPSPRAVSPSAILFGLSPQTKAVFFRQLATMVHSGLPVSRAVHTAGQAGMAEIASEISGLIDHGSTLAEALARFPYHFDRYEIAMAKAGETAGQLDRQLMELAKTSEATWALTKSITGKMVYPMVVLHGAILLPPLFLLVKDGPEAYLRTVLMVLIPLYLVMVSTFLSYRFFRTHGGPRRLFDHFFTAMPLVGPPMKLSARIRFFEALGNLVEAGFLPDQAIPLAAESCGNFWLRDQVMEAWKILGHDNPISDILRKSKAFSHIELGLVVTGEESGHFAATLKKSAESLKPDFEAHVHRLTTVMPVVLLLIVGGIVGFIAVKSMMGILAPLNQI